MQEHYVPTDDAISSYAITQRDIYEYDYLNRIKQVTGVQRTTAGAWPTIYGQGFIYDRWGNRRIDPATDVTWGNAINNAFFTIDPANNNRLVGLGYDNAGNVTNDTITGSGARTYDAENRMTSAQGAGGTSYYVYDADGKRVRRITGGVETWHIYGFGGELIAEYPANCERKCKSDPFRKIKIGPPRSSQVRNVKERMLFNEISQSFHLRDWRPSHSHH